MQNRARAGARPSMMAWFATMVMMLLALVNACIVVDGSVVPLNMHRHDTRVKEMRRHDVLTAIARSSGGGAIGFDDGKDICNDDDCMMTTTNTLDADDDEASVNDLVENYKSTARELVAGRVSVDTDATITRSEIEENESILDRCDDMSRDGMFKSVDMVEYTIADWVLYNNRELGSTRENHRLAAMAIDGSSGMGSTFCCSLLNLNILRNGWRITKGDSAGIIREDEYEAVNASDDDQRCIGKAYHEVSSNGFGRAHDLDCWEVKRVDLAIFIELAWADHSISKVLEPIRASAADDIISKASEESGWDFIECGKTVESSSRDEKWLAEKDMARKPV